MSTDELFKTIRNSRLFTEILDIEGTRRCNIKCAHCMHGKAQNKNMPTKTLRAILDAHKKVGKLVFTGGEYGIDLDFLARAQTELAQKGVHYYEKVGTVTNGIGLDKEYLDLCNAIGKMSYYGAFTIGLSNTEFHRAEYTRLGIDYEENCDRIIAMSKGYQHIVLVPRSYVTRHDFKLYDVGNATKITDASKVSQIEAQQNSSLVFNTRKTRLNRICYNVNGFITKTPVTYKQGDQQNFGNILDAK